MSKFILQKTTAMLATTLSIILTACGGGDGGATVLGTNASTLNECGYTGKLSGVLVYDLKYDLSHACTGSRDAAKKILYTGFGGFDGRPGISIAHESFQAGALVNDATAHISVHVLSTGHRWVTVDGACTINITSNNLDNAAGNVKIAGSGSCASAAIADASTGASGEISLGDFKFKSLEVTWP